MKRLSALAQLVALYAECKGITSTIELARLTGRSDRAIRKAKTELYDRHGTTGSAHQEPQIPLNPEPQVPPPSPSPSPLKKKSLPHTPSKEKIHPPPHQDLSSSQKSPSTLPAGTSKKESPPTQSLIERVSAVDDPDGSDEDRFWAAVGVLAKAGVPRSQMAKLAKLSDGFDECLATLRRVAEARNPATYLAKIVHNLKAEADAYAHVGKSDEPEFVREFRAYGYEVRRDKDGKRWWCGGTTYDHEGCEC